MHKKKHIMPLSKEIQEQMRNKIVDMSGKGYKAISKEQWWTFPGVASLPKLLQEHDSSRRS